MGKNTIIVIGASAGGFEALQTLVAALPTDLPASIFIVWHMSAEVTGILPHVLNKYDTLPAANAVDGEAIVPGRIYVAPPDRHLILEEGRVRTTRGPKENRFRPAVDPLFRSAAAVYGPQVIGIILTGALDDGTSGLWTVKQCGGIAIVQHPRDAAVPSMPESALREVDVDYSIPLLEMPALLVRLCTETISAAPESKVPAADVAPCLEAEVHVSMLDINVSTSVAQFGELSSYACPECHGVLSTLRDGKRVRFRCHTGHAYSAESLLMSVTEAIDDSIWNAVRGVEESILLLNHMGDHHAEANNTHLAAKYFQKATEAGERLKGLKGVLSTNDTLTAECIEGEDKEP